MDDHLVALVTAPSSAVARDVARALLDRKLVACVNILPPMTSLYTWEGELCVDEEVLLIIKTAERAMEELTAVVQDLHPYDVAEIIAVPVVSGSKEYLDWVDDIVESP